MIRFRHSLIALSLSAALLAGCGEDKATTPVAAPEKAAPAAPAADAASVMNEQIAAFKANDLKAMLMAAVPAKDIEEMKAEWDKKRAEPISEEESKEFADSWGKIIAADGVDQMMAEIEPKLAEMKPQMAGLMAMVQGMATMSIQQSTELTDAQKTQMTQFMTGLNSWMMKTDFTDPALARSALTALADGLRATGVTSLDQLNQKSFDDLLVLGGQVMGGVKGALGAYGLSLDEIAGSMKATQISTEGDLAKLKVEYSLFGSPLSFESEMKKQDGRWYSKDMLEQVEKVAAEDGEPVEGDSSADESDSEAADQQP
jgi:hypothetical protein